MSSNQIINPLFVPDTFYHIYNRGNNRERNFLKIPIINSFKSFFTNIHLIGSILAYCLIPNHFHFLIKTKSGINSDKNYKPDEINAPICEQFRKMFMRYSKSINVQEDRVGSLFQKNFKRKPVLNDNHLKLLVAYIHLNPLLHSITADFRNYKWSSYQSILSNKPSNLKRTELLEYFDGKDEFIKYHKNYKENKEIHNLIEMDYEI